MYKTILLLALVAVPMSMAATHTTATGNEVRLTQAQKKKMLKKFDKDRDGKLNAEERAAAKQALINKSEKNQ